MSQTSEPVKMKVEMKNLIVSDPSRKQILETLKFLHGEDFAHKDRSWYKDKGARLDRKYWVDSGNLIIQGGIDFSNRPKKTLLPHEQMHLFATAKLRKYGFHRKHCIEALQVTGGDVGGAYELLMSRYFNLDLPEPEDVPPEILEERNYELDSLRSIFDDMFQERIHDQLWVVHLDLSYISEQVCARLRPPEKGKVKKKSNQEMCRRFMSDGHCKFGERCRFSHEKEESRSNQERPAHPDDKDWGKFVLEIRFPMGCRYPEGCCLVSLRAVASDFPDESCMAVSRLLVREAVRAAETATPCVYSLVDLLMHRPEEVKQALEEGPMLLDPTTSLIPHQEPQEQSNLNTFEDSSTHQTSSSTSRSRMYQYDAQARDRDNKELVRRFRERQRGMRYKSLIASRKKLPAWKKQSEILKAVRDNQVVVISGDTGCGKSTQVPQFLLDEWLSNYNGEDTEIVCTQPRRISAIGVAERVACERMEPLPESVGYQIRLETCKSHQTRLLFCTTGILLRRLEGDPLLSSVTHVIVDEVHERTEESDLLLMLLKDLLLIRGDLKVILMSATLNASLFSIYFGQPPVIDIPGRTFPVKDMFLEDVIEATCYVLEEDSEYCRKMGKSATATLEALETELEIADVQSADMIPNEKVRDQHLTIRQLFYRYSGYSRETCKTLYLMDTEKLNNELIEKALEWVIAGDHEYPKTGSIVVFLPGLAEISSLHEALSDHPFLSPKSRRTVLVPLHSSLSSEEQSLVFKKTEKGVRKIVLSTNIAETSITIDDCVFVIDAGRMKEKRFDSNKNMESLETVWVSRANAVQRRGRAGRVMPGVCLHLFTRHQFIHHFLAQPVPEIHRVPLEQLLLKIKILPGFTHFDVYAVLGKMVEPPEEKNITGALNRLRDVGAVDDGWALTALGRHLASLPVDVRIGKLMILGSMLACLDSALTIAACLSYRNPFLSPFDKREAANAKKREFATAYSDHLTILKAYKSWMKVNKESREGGRVYAQENFLSLKTMYTLADIKAQLLELLTDIGFVPRGEIKTRRRTGIDNVLDVTGPKLNTNGENERVLAAILCASLYPNIVKVLTPAKQYAHSISGAVPLGQKPEELKFETKEEKVAIHPSSVNHSVSSYPSPYLVYQEKVKTSRVFIRECTLVPVLPLVMFSAGTIRVELYSGQFVVSIDDGWILFSVQSNEIAELLESIKQEFLQLLDEKIKDPTMDLQTHPKGKRIISTIVYLVTHG